MARRAPGGLGAAVRSAEAGPAIVSWWLVEAGAAPGERRTLLVPLAVRPAGTRVPPLERSGDRLLDLPPGAPLLEASQRRALLAGVVEPTLHRELHHRGLLAGGGSFSSELVAWLEITA